MKVLLSCIECDHEEWGSSDKEVMNKIVMWNHVKKAHAATAERIMKIYLQARPDDASAHYGLGRVYELGMHFDQAKTEFLRSTELQPVQTEAWYELGVIALRQNDYTGAMLYFQKVLARNGLHGGALADAGQALYREKHYEEALVYLRRAVAAAPDYQPGHYYLGLTLTRLGQKEEAERELQTAEKLADEIVDRLALTLSNMGI